MDWQTRAIQARYDVLAPDGSEIRLLPATARGSLVQCRLQPGQVTHAVQHRTVDEVWYCTRGSGKLWRANGAGAEEVVDLSPGTGVSIPVGTRFQFRADGSDGLEIIIATLPPWPGPSEAVAVEGCWEPTTIRPG